MADRDVEPFNRWAPTYERGSREEFFKRLHGALLKWVIEEGKTPRHVLDVGCGTGALLRLAAQRWPDAVLTGADPAEEMIRVAKAKLPEGSSVTLVTAPAERLPFDDERFELVVSSVSFHHWTDQAAGISEIYRVLARGGHLCLADHFAVGLLHPFFVALRKRDRMHTRPEVNEMLERAGLRVVGWRIVARLGPLPFIRAVMAIRPHS
jgi:ubiquinone/menaquinone biosynthesis C-methylase UbiE